MITEYQLLCGLVSLFKTNDKLSIKDLNSIYEYMILYNNFKSYIDNNHINIFHGEIIKIVELFKKLDKKYKANIIYILERVKYLISNNNSIVVESNEEINNINKEKILQLLLKNNFDIKNIKYLVKNDQLELNEIIIIRIGNFVLKLSFINFIMQNIQDKKSTNFWQFVYEQ
ncbi:hypothetical protein IOLA_159 [uncultured bacterium]|nr:hypothetical protein IOLA_159 [uncultured bacterium]